MLQSNPVRRTRIGWAGFHHEQDDDDDDGDHHHHHYWLWLLMKTINTTESGFWLEGFLSLWKVTCWMFNTFWEYYLRVLVLSKDKANRSPQNVPDYQIWFSKTDQLSSKIPMLLLIVGFGQSSFVDGIFHWKQVFHLTRLKLFGNS